MGSGNPESPTKAPWTAEQTIQGFKEVITAILGVTLVGFTIYLAAKTFSYVGQDNNMSDAKDILLLMMGLAGVVVGYYFGRVPADARATQAQEQANSASAQTEQVTVQARTMADQVDQVLDKIGPAAAATRGAGASPIDTAIAADLQHIRDGLRAIGAVGRPK